MRRIYQAMYWLVLQRLPAEGIHHASFWALRASAKVPGMRTLLRKFFAPHYPKLAVSALGLEFPNPIGLAAGFDKDGKGIHCLDSLGFGFIEIGTITAQPQRGNPKPRLFRLVKDKAILNRMGFNNSGARAASMRLQQRGAGVIGANIGKTKIVEEHDAVADYCESAKLLAPYCDYLVVNVSSPNTPGLRNLQAVDKLAPILQAVRQALEIAVPLRKVPLFVKIAPDLADDDIDAVARLALSLGIDGIIATNTTISRSGLRTESSKVAKLGAGGISGDPVRERSVAVLRRLASLVHGKLVLISVGGVTDGNDAWARICAGATLVQGYTGFIYRGPTYVKDILDVLEANRIAHGYASIQDAIGCDVRANAATRTDRSA